MDDLSKILKDLDTDLLDDFIDGIEENTTEIERVLTILDSYTTHQDSINRLFRALHNLKINSRLIFMDYLVSFIHSLETLVSSLRDNKISYSKDLGEVILYSVDEFKMICEAIAHRQSLNLEYLHTIKEKINKLNRTPSSNFNVEVKTILADFIKETDSLPIDEDVEHLTTKIQDKILPFQSTSEDLALFQDLASTCDNRLPEWRDRSKTILNLSLMINKHLPQKEDEQQLTAAVYMHDFGMALLPERLIAKRGKYDVNDIMILQEHPSQTYEILCRFNGWSAAARIVREHHERFDGTGYPAGLKDDEISVGAKIIAVADAFFSMTHQRPDRDYKKSVLRAISEINRNSGTQFDPIIIGIFNATLNMLQQ